MNHDLLQKTVLGIDFGTKRVGLALKICGSSLAFPVRVIANNTSLDTVIADFASEHDVDTIVLGESLDLRGSENVIMNDIRQLEFDLNKLLDEVAIFYEPEYFSSVQAERWQGKTDHLDASAAAIILQAWLDRQSNNK